jgi:TolA-binding protein
MARKLGRVYLLSSLGLFTVASLWAQPYPVRLQPVAATSQPVAAPQVQPATQEDRETQQLLQQLTALGETLVREIQSPHVWKLQIQQGDVLLQIAHRSKGAERDHFLRMAMDTYLSAAISSPANEPLAWGRVDQLPGHILQYFPGCNLYSTAALKGLRAQHTRQTQSGQGSSAQNEVALAQRLLSFAQQYPQAPEAPQVIQEAAQIYETQGNKGEAGRCHRLLADQYAGTPVARQARLALRRLGGIDGEIIPLQLPLLYPTSASGNLPYDIQDLHAELIVLVFWSSDSPGLAEEFDAVKRLTDRYHSRGLEVVYVCMDEDANRAREFLSGRVLTGTHVWFKDGLKSAFAERYGLERLPEAFLLSQGRAVLTPSLSASQMEAAVAAHLHVPARGR